MFQTANGESVRLPSWCRRVVLVGPRLFEMSGGSTVVRNLAGTFARAGAAVEIISIYPGELMAGLPVDTVYSRENLHRRPVIDRSASFVTQAVRLPLLLAKRIDRWRIHRRLRERLLAYGEDTVIIVTHATARRVLRESGFRRREGGALVVGQHHSAFESVKHEAGLCVAIREEFAGDDAFIALSEHDAQRFATLVGIPTFAIPNMTSFGSASPSRSPASPVTHRAVALARFAPEKQLDLMIRAFVAATESRTHWTLDLYGEGDLASALEATISELKAEGRVQLRGRTDDVPGVLASADLNLLTSSSEGFPLSVLEAAEAGVMSVAFDCSPGLHELMTTVSGVLVDPAGGEAAYAATLGCLMEDDSEIRKGGMRAMDGASKYSPAAVLLRWIGVLGEVRPR